MQHADFLGDSFQLANAAQTVPNAEAIVFCGVHFMAETADILARPEQAVILPNLAAGCSMADMADIDSVEECWAQLEALYGTEPDADGRVPVIPVTYMNSSAALKGFCGRHGGIVCTSSNAETVLEWAFERGQRVLFFPDQHLGRNTAKKMGVPLERMPMWNPRKPLGGNDAATTCSTPRSSSGTASARCTSASPSTRSRRRAPSYPGVRVIVHPECPMPVVDAADESGSTDYIRKAVAAATEPTTFAIGTEINMVNRLAAEYPQHTIFCLDPVVCPCSTMYRIHPGYLAWVLEALVAGEVLNVIEVPDEVAGDARVALERMLAAKPKTTGDCHGTRRRRRHRHRRTHHRLPRGHRGRPRGRARHQGGARGEQHEVRAGRHRGGPVPRRQRRLAHRRHPARRATASATRGPSRCSAPRVRSGYAI